MQFHPDDDTGQFEKPSAPTTFGQRHGVTILTVMLAAMFFLVIFVQVAC